MGFPSGLVVKNPLAKTHGFDPWSQEDALEKEIAAHSSILA